MNKIQVTQQQRDNAIEARDVMWPSVPPENVIVNLSWWTRNLNGIKSLAGDPKRQGRAATCGTMACFGGWVAQWPPFQSQGVEPDEEDGSPILDTGGWSSGCARKLFGCDGDDLFSPRNSRERGTDHEIVTKRLNKLIRNSVVIS